MFNANKITSELSRMPDAALQQFASMHKTDPYMLSLAVAESNRRKEMRGAAVQGAPNEAPVVDQEISNMGDSAPYQNAGLSSTQVPSPVRMAGGGVVAFSGGGPTGLSADEMQEYGSTGIPSFGFVKDYADYQAQRMKRREAESALQQQYPNDGPEYWGSEGKRVVMPVAASRAAPVSQNAPQAAPEAPPKMAGVQAAMSQRAASKSGPAVDDYETMANAVESRADKKNAGTDDFYKAYKEQMDADRAEIRARKQSNTSEALVRAGLGMMAGTSPYALANIGAGGAEGLKSYQEGQKEQDAAARSNMQAQMLLAQAQRAERSGNQRDATDLYGKYLSARQGAASIEAHRQTEAAKMGQMRDYASQQRLAELGRLLQSSDNELKGLQQNGIVMPDNVARVKELRDQSNMYRREIASMAGVGGTMPQLAPAASGGWGKATVVPTR